MIGNSSELISRANILAAIDRSWGKFSIEKFTDKEIFFWGEIPIQINRQSGEGNYISQKQCRSQSATKRRKASQIEGDKEVRSFFDKALLSSTGTDRSEGPHHTANRGTRGEDTAKEGSIQVKDKSTHFHEPRLPAGQPIRLQQTN